MIADIQLRKLVAPNPAFKKLDSPVPITHEVLQYRVATVENGKIMWGEWKTVPTER